LTSRSEMLYPEAYRGLSTVYWRTLSNEDRQQGLGVQARAMEQVGYERGTDKHFAEEIFPEDDYDYLKNRKARSDDTRGIGVGLSPEAIAVTIIVLALLAALGFYAMHLGDDVSVNRALKGTNPSVGGG